MWASIISTLVFVIGTAFGVFEGIHLSNLQKQKMPENVSVRLEQFARMAVRQIEQQNKSLSSEAKKSLAVIDVTNLFVDYKLPIPSKKSINIAIESAVFLLPKTIS